MRLVSNFNSFKTLIQNVRYENMAYLSDQKPSINDIERDEVEVITNLDEFAHIRLVGKQMTCYF